MSQRMQQPMFILSEDSERTQGESAQQSNIRAGRAIASAVRTTLGPKGMDKMLVDSSGDVVVTNDGATILDEMDIEHPAAGMIVDVAESQEEEVGDGTTTAAVLAGELLSRAEDLLDDDIHPTTIVEGYHEAGRLAREAIEEQTLAGDPDDETLGQVAETSMTGKGTGGVGAVDLADLVVRAVRQVESDGEVHPGAIHIETRTGAASSASELVEGVIADEGPANDNMPRSVSDATVALLDVELDVRTGESDAEYQVSSADQLSAAIEAEEAELREYADTLADAGVDVVFSMDDIEDRVAAYLADAGILAVESLDSDTGRALARTTGAAQLGSLGELDSDDFGHAESVSVETYGEDDLTFVSGGAATEAVTLFLRGSTEYVVDELERAINDAVDVVTAAIQAGGVVPGAGGTEIAIADHVRNEVAGVEGRKQLAIEAFADAVDALPRTLAENTGMDPIDALVDLRAEFEAENRAGIISTSRSGSIGDPVAEGVLDPAAVKREAVDSATESATVILRIDDVISAE